ncbi:MAG: homoaconitate hydratase family protein, partial [Thermoplasmata archaeon]|nr:homoaconitate hydratase family protein [Thermoplasmata archaeon]
MPMTVVEKIMAAHSGKEEVSPGEILWIDVDVRTARDFGGPNVVKHLKKHFSPPYVDDPDKTFFTFDLSTPARTIKYAISQHLLKEFAKETGVTVFDVDEGIGTHVLIEKGVVKPGDVAVGTDSHYNILGAIGVFGQGMGDKDIAFAFKTGKIWFEVPPTMKIRVEGEYSWPATARDLTFAVMGEVGSSGALGRAIEYEGEAIERLSLDGRITLASQTTEMGGIIGFIPLSEEVKRFVEERSGGSIKEVLPDRGAEYVDELNVDVGGL